MNAVERYWDAVAAGDRRRAADELHAHVVVEWPVTGRRFDSRDEYLLNCAEAAGPGPVEVTRVVTQGRTVATEIRLTGGRVIAAFYRLHDGRIQSAVEYWVSLPAPPA